MSNVKFKSSKEIIKASKKYSEDDCENLEYAASLISDGEYGQASVFIGNLDTILREECYEVFTPKSDDYDPQFLFSTTATELLTMIVKGEIDAKELAWKQLRNRGQDANGLWAGFGEGRCKKPY